jgi:D-threo-aldose 1-dehydrogenase
LVVGVHSAQQISEDWNSMQAKIPQDFWAELVQEKLIDPNAQLPKQSKQ